MTKGQMDIAQKCFEKVLTLQPNSPTVYTNLGHVLEAQGKFNEALNAYGRALELNPEATEVFYQWEHLRLTLCHWDDFEPRVQTLTERIQNHLNTPGSPRLAPLSLSSFPVPIELHTALNRHWGQTITQTMAELKTHCAFTPRLTPKEKIRLGYLSGDFRSHAVGSLIAQIFQYHDRATFEVYAYSLADTEDEITTIIQNGCDAFVNIATLSVEEGARRIYHDQIDILIDLAGYTTFCRPEILALQPAPIQIQYLGYPDTMGAEFIQYILTDHWIIPPELAPHYTERVIELPHAFVTAPQEISSNVPTRSALGLPEQGFVYCCFNRTDKFDPHLFTAWMHILQQVPESVLWLSEVTPEISATLGQKAQAQGIDPQRLVFSPRLPMSEFLAICQRADLFLDTFTYNAGATAICGLQAGLPLLTCPGETFASRMVASICASVGLESLICDSPQTYEQQAIYLGTHPETVKTIRDRLLQEKDELPLFQPEQWVNNLDSVLQKLWQDFVNLNGGQAAAIAEFQFHPHRELTESGNLITSLPIQTTLRPDICGPL
jgi:predicted O-linked N-acetylglucosamine transferase (SPINDLY family)